MWWMEAFTDASARSWEAFLRSLPGAPGRVVCELHYGQRTALVRLWPETEVYLCEWHLQHALERLMNTERRRNPQHAQAIDALVPCIERAFDGRYFWRPFAREVRAAGIDALDLWLEEMDPPIEDQFARRGPASGRPADMPLSTGGPGAARSPHQGLAPPAPLRAQEPRAAQPASAANAAPPQRLGRPNRLRHPHSRPAHRQQRPPTRGAPRHRRPREAPHCAEIGPSRPIVTPTRSERGGGRLRRCCSARPPRRINESARLGGDQESSLQAAAR